MRYSFAYDLLLAASSWKSRPALALCASEVLPVPSLSMFQVQRKVRVFIYSAIGDDDYDYDGDSDSDDVVIDVP